MSIRAVRIGSCAAVAAAVFLLYRPYLDLFIAWDDILWLSWSKAAHLGDVPRFFTRSSGCHNYRPLTTSVFFAAGQAIWGMNPCFFRLCNVLVLTANAMMVFCLFDKLSRNPYAAFIAALLYGTHFSHGLVIHLSHIQGLGSTLFFLIAFLLYVKAGEKGKPSYRLLSFLAFACALLSREESVVLPLALLAYGFIFSDEANRTKRLASAVRGACPYFVVLLAYLMWRFVILGISLPPRGGYKPVFDAGAVIVKYATYVWWSLYGPQWPLAIMVVVILGAALIRLWRTRLFSDDDSREMGVVVFCASLFFVYLLPVCLIEYTARHFLSTALIGIAGIEGVIFCRIIRNAAKGLRYALAFTLVGAACCASILELRRDASRGELGDFIKATRYNADIVRQAKGRFASVPRGATIHVIGVPVEYRGEFENVPGLLMLAYGDRSLKIDFWERGREAGAPEGDFVLSLEE